MTARGLRQYCPLQGPPRGLFGLLPSEAPRAPLSEELGPKRAERPSDPTELCAVEDSFKKIKSHKHATIHSATYPYFASIGIYPNMEEILMTPLLFSLAHIQSF